MAAQRVAVPTLDPDVPGFRQEVSLSCYPGLVQLDIPGGPLGEVVSALAGATGANITLSSEAIGPIYSTGVSGTFTLEQAFAAVTRDTNIAFRLTTATSAVPSDVINILKAMSLRPGVLRASMGLYREIMFGESGLTRKERELLATVASAAQNCDY